MISRADTWAPRGAGVVFHEKSKRGRPLDFAFLVSRCCVPLGVCLVKLVWTLQVLSTIS
jgi:hypothetical protein